MCCSVLQCVVVCCSVLQCVAYVLHVACAWISHDSFAWNNCGQTLKKKHMVYVTWLILAWHDLFDCNMTHSYVTWLIHVWHDSFICDIIDMWHDLFMCDMTHSRVTWLIHMWHWSSTRYMWHDSFIRHLGSLTAANWVSFNLMFLTPLAEVTP